MTSYLLDDKGVKLSIFTYLMTSVLDDDLVKLSIGSTRTRLSNQSSFVKHHAILGVNTHASYHSYPQRRPITFSRSDMQLFTQACLYPSLFTQPTSFSTF